MYAVNKPLGILFPQLVGFKVIHIAEGHMGEAGRRHMSVTIHYQDRHSNFLSSTTSGKYMFMQVNGLNVHQVRQASLRPASPSLDCRLFLQKPQLEALARGTRSLTTMEVVRNSLVF